MSEAVICPHCLKATPAGQTCAFCGMSLAGAITAQGSTTPETLSVRVVVTDVDISFGNMLVLMFKFSLCLIPLAILWFAITAVLAGLLGGLPTR